MTLKQVVDIQPMNRWHQPEDRGEKVRDFGYWCHPFDRLTDIIHVS